MILATISVPLKRITPPIALYHPILADAAAFATFRLESTSLQNVVMFVIAVSDPIIDLSST